MGSCSVTMGTEFAALNPGLRRYISTSHAWHSLLLTLTPSPAAVGCSLLLPTKRKPSVLGTWGLGDSAAAAVWHSWVGICPLLFVAGSPCNAPISRCLHTEHLGFVPQERAEACSRFLLNHLILWAGSRLCQFVTGNGK